MSSGLWHTCAQTQTVSDDPEVYHEQFKLVCWGSNHFSQIDIPQGIEGEMGRVNSRLQVVSGPQNNCVQLQRIRCWGLDIGGINDVPEGLQHGEGQSVDVGELNVCAVKQGFKEWERGSPNPKNVQGGFGKMLKQNSNKIVCWGLCMTGVCDVSDINKQGQDDEEYNYQDNRLYSMNQVQQTARKVSVGSFHACVLQDSTQLTFYNQSAIHCWGSNNSGQISVQDTYRYNVKSIASGLGQTCVVLTHNKYKCWGAMHELDVIIKDEEIENDDGMEGVPQEVDEQDDSDVKLDKQDMLDKNQIMVKQIDDGNKLKNVLQRYTQDVSVGGRHSCLIRGGVSKCQGNNDFSQLDVEKHTLIPSQLNSSNKYKNPNFWSKKILSGWDQTCMLSIDNQLSCIGFNQHSQTEFPYSMPLYFDTNLHQEITKLSVGLDHSCALLHQSDNQLKLLLPFQLLCWGGRNHSGESDQPAEAKGRIGPSSELSVGDDHSCLTLQPSPGKVNIVCWGSNEQGQCDVPGSGREMGLDQGGTSLVGRQERVIGVDGVGVIVNSTGFAEGGVQEGSGNYTNINNNTTTTTAAPNNTSEDGSGAVHLSTLVTVTQPAQSPRQQWANLKSGANHLCATRANFRATVLCWGADNQGQVSLPAVFAFTLDGRSLDQYLGAVHTCIIAGTKLSCYGRGYEMMNNPYQANVGKFRGEFLNLAAGFAHDCGVYVDGSSICQGDNDDGQLDIEDESESLSKLF